MSVASHHPDYDKYLPMWQRCSDAVDGQAAIHAKGAAYLERLTDETDLDYKSRLGRADYFNATWRTIAGLTGMAFNKPPSVKLPAGIEKFAADINLAGLSLDDLAKELVEDVLEYGRMGLLVDHPPAPVNVTGLTIAASEALGIRPSIQVYEAEHIINWRYARVRNAYMLVMVVLQESASIAEDEFEHKTEARYRVLDLDSRGAYRQRVFRIDKDGKDEQVGDNVFPLMNGKLLGYLPFAFIGAAGRGDKIDAPPLIDLVDANIAHYQINADYRHGLHYTALPTAVVAGYQANTGDKKLYIGSREAWAFPDPQAKAYFLEFTGQGLGAIETALQGLEKRMAILGARMLSDETRHVETATATQIKRVGENSILANIVISVADALEWALGIFAQWAGASGEIRYEINREFTPAPMDAQTLTALVGAWQSGALSESELFGQLQRGDVIDGQKTLEEHQAEVDLAPQMPAPVIPAKAA